jgi:toxin ParE1/3/4
LSLPLIILDDAESELKAAIERYDQQVEGLGSDLQASVTRVLDLISSLPSIGRPEPTQHSVKLRRVPVERFPFSVVYLIEPTLIWVIAFPHHRQRPGYWRSRLR